MTIQNKRVIGILITVAVLLLIPFMAMTFTNELNWSRFDLIVVGVLLFSTGLLCELVLRTVKSTRYRIAICLAILAVLALIWIELAVGLFGTRFAGS
jgi:hypothetical protein